MHIKKVVGTGKIKNTTKFEQMATCYQFIVHYAKFTFAQKTTDPNSRSMCGWMDVLLTNHSTVYFISGKKWMYLNKIYVPQSPLKAKAITKMMTSCMWGSTKML